MFQPWTISAPLVPLAILLIGIGSVELARFCYKAAVAALRMIRQRRERRRLSRPWKPARRPRMAKRNPR